MGARARTVGFLLAAAAALAGVLLGASVQHEEILHTQLRDADRAADRAATGNLIPLTALLIALGSGLAAATLGRARPLRRTLGALALATSTYVLVQAVQTAWPNYLIVEDSVTLSLSLLASNAPAAPSLLMPVLAVVAAALWSLVWGARTALGTQAPSTLADLSRRHLGRVLFAIPFLAVGTWGPIRLMLALPAGDPGAVGHIVILGFQALTATGLATLLLLQHWQLVTATREPRLQPYASDAWRTLQIVHRILVALLLVLPFTAAAMPRVPLAELQSGFVFGATLGSHQVMMASLALPLLPAWTLGKRITDRLAEPPTAVQVTEPNTATTPALHPDTRTLLLIAMLGAWIGAGLATFLSTGALWPWLAAAGPGILLARQASVASRALGWMLAAYILWAIGNTVTAGFVQATDVTIRYGTHPGILALWRIAAVALAAAAWTTLLVAARNGPRAPALGRAVGAAIGLGLAALVELPLWAWTIQTLGGEAVGLGSLPSSQDTAVRWLMHLLAAVGLLGAASMAARIHRPDWFRRDAA